MPRYSLIHLFVNLVEGKEEVIMRAYEDNVIVNTEVKEFVDVFKVSNFEHCRIRWGLLKKASPRLPCISSY